MSDFQSPNSPPPGWQGQPAQQIYVSQLAGPPRGLSVASMVIGLVSIVGGFTLVLPIVGLILGIVGTRREPMARGMSLTGIILNGVILLGWVVIVIFVVTVGLAGLGAAGSSTS
jgi:hypothetical protein